MTLEEIQTLEGVLDVGLTGPYGLTGGAVLWVELVSHTWRIDSPEGALPRGAYRPESTLFVVLVNKTSKLVQWM